MGATGIKPLRVSPVGLTAHGDAQEHQENRPVTMDVHRGGEETQKLEQAGPRSGWEQIGTEWGYGWIDCALQE